MIALATTHSAARRTRGIPRALPWLLLLASTGCPSPTEPTEPTPVTEPVGVVDADGDGFAVADDCDDLDAAVNPDADELCNGIDDDCDDTIDDDAIDRTAYYPDTDGDRIGAEPAVLACDMPADHVTRGGDCNDTDATVFPGADELCDDVDHDCDHDPTANATDAQTWYADTDSDTYGDPANTTTACEEPHGFVHDDQDCDDTNPFVNPRTPWYDDLDGDGFGDRHAETASCVAPANTVDDDQDCDDTDSDVNPSAVETCDSVDNDCDGMVDSTTCFGFEGSWEGSFTLGAIEQVGTTVVNDMQCSAGTTTLSIDLAAADPVVGTTTCTYSGGISGFATTQTGTISGTVLPDGTVNGTYTHVYGTNPDDTYVFTADLNAGTLDGTGGYLPNPSSTVPWDVTLSSTTLVNLSQP